MPSAAPLHTYLALLLLLLAAALPAAAQEADTTTVVAPPDTTALAPRPDSTAAPLPHALPAALSPGRSTPPPPPDDALDAPVEFAASDSLVLLLDGEEGDLSILFGDAAVTYGETRLGAYRVDILFGRDELRAEGLPSDTGLVGRPQIEDRGETFSGERLAYNLRTERGRVVGARTQIDDGFIRADVVKVTPDTTLYIRDGAYTTCPCIDDPSYTLRAEKMKIVDKEWIYTGPIQLFLFNIPTPLWLPFGFLPAREGRRSGPLPPRYGEDERGFYLRDWGWYQAINEYTDLQVRLGIWTRGSWQVAPLFRYNRRYHYTGQAEIDYVHNRRGEKGDPDLTVFNTASLRWNHNQTLSPTATFGANVNLSTQNYLRTVSEQYDDRVRQTIQSSVRYNKRWTSGGRSLGINLNHRQVVATGETNLTLPDLTFSQSARQPFRSGAASQSDRWYELVTVSYTGTLRNQFAFRPDTSLFRDDPDAADIAWYDALFSPDRYRRATGKDFPYQVQASHRVPVSASFSVERVPGLGAVRLNLAPSLNYTEDWFIRTQRKLYDDSTRAVVTDEIGGFFALRQFSASISANTTFYGLFPLNVWRFEGFRHTVRPSLAFSYAPDYQAPGWGYTRTYTGADGAEVTYPIVNTFLGRRQQTLSFRLSNVFETKWSRPDTTVRADTRPLKLLDLDLNTGYNFAADSLRLGDVSLNARTSIANQFHFTFDASLSPYALNAAGTQTVNRFVASENLLRLARLTRMSLSVRTAFRSDRQGASRPATTARARMSPFPLDPAANFLTPADPFSQPYYGTRLGYVDFAVPWSLDLDLTYGISKPTTNLTRRAILNASFDVSLTPNWKVQGRSGYDFELGDFATTNLSIFRDFECWEMSFTWVPFGLYQSFGFDLHVKSGKLRDLLRIQQPRSDVRGRFTNLLE